MKSVKVNLLIMESFWEVFDKEKDLTQSYQKRTKVIAYLNIVSVNFEITIYALFIIQFFSTEIKSVKYTYS